MNKPKIVQAQCPSCNYQTEDAYCITKRRRGHQTDTGVWFRNLDCNQWAPMSTREVVPELCPTCGRPIEAAKTVNES